MTERIVITGMGTVNGLGLSVSETWERAINGVSRLGPITLFDTKDHLVKTAYEVRDFQVEKYIPFKEARRRDRYAWFAAASTAQALEQAGLKASEVDTGRVGVIYSSAVGGLGSFEEQVVVESKEGPRRISPFTIPIFMSNGASGLIAIDHGFHGPSFSVASACASSADGIGMAWMMLRTGVIDAAITGGADSTITPVGVAAFDRMGAMARREVGDLDAPQPFDKNRDGLVMGEGATTLILERESFAKARGAEILAELAGYASTADASHITAPDENGAGGARAMTLAIASAGVNADEVGYINAHGTGTPLNDLAETRGIKAAFGKLAYNIPVSSTKSMTGHMMGATGALEAMFCVQVVRNGIIPPTIHYQTPDPDCDLDYTPNTARQTPVRVAISNAFGFGGHNAVLVIRSYS